ncbi:3-oxoacyl-ACP reductase [Kocuria rosea]|uniref:3-oxoacyl-ACP reductase n=1 Tax=Kocuria rosea TaxID=1275 RepID=UPI0020423631|nr:3-oxoacyl-ACP reductase [Kocuria rosea]MCM3687898.1 3-oxoacyl-ACP reductase [Kocuria rosea]
MADTYLDLVSSAPGAELARRLGLPRPVRLRRHRAGAPLVPGPVLVLGRGEEADRIAAALLGWDLDVRRHPDDVARFGAIVLALTELTAPAQLAEPALGLGGVLRSLAPGGRVVAVSRPAPGIGAGAASATPAGAVPLPPAEAAARQAVVGLLRSVAQELRGGATANGVLLAEGVAPEAPSVLGALRFLLSGRSAFVSGQFVTVGDDAGSLPADWEAPLRGRVAAVTGAARGIGAQIARTLAEAGARVVVVDVPAAGEALAGLANELRAVALQLDVTDERAGERILELARERFGCLDVVVHNAGITRDKLLANMDEARWSSVLAVNLESQLRMNDQLLAGEGLGQAPRIVCLASTSGVAGNRGQTNYAASKAGVIGMVAATAPLLARRGGTINAVAPGFIETEMTARIPAARRQVARRLNSLQQGGLPEDVAQAVLFLASDAAGGVNGQTLRVCGQNLVGA